ncbi:ABC-type uncharacterized transport system fused permease/ATPase subunit [Variovorax boronicumulans]|uniref:ABC-type uncharacterized transport system fused permease/ATPase subunit n=1 Tax=Variovorax boronicumulans TaxID=436515 RepID=A0AAW8CTJ2_9BURK|nr:ABC-type uncharacterized transport system fused permease/ATPase subunit [Variovorax boronicumulans]MDQ0051924.1 ABC-type uncharacterized transport system fused permease/ATPase subunit [Variovorax boronicumulans]
MPLSLWTQPSRLYVVELRSGPMNIELFGFEIPAFLLWKVLGLCALAFIVNFIYTWKTGRNLTDDRNRLAKQEAPESVQSTQDRVGR